MIWRQYGIMRVMKSRLCLILTDPFVFPGYAAGMIAATITHTYDLEFRGVSVPPVLSWAILASLIGLLLMLMAPDPGVLRRIEDKTFIDWYREGVSKGYCSEGFCCTHDGPPLTEIEEAQFEDGDDPCVFGVRTYSTKKRGDV